MKQSSGGIRQKVEFLFTLGEGNHKSHLPERVCPRLGVPRLFSFEERLKEATSVCLKSALITISIVLIATFANAEVSVDMKKIMFVESSGNPMAWNKTDDSRGLFQITPIVLKEYNNFHPSAKLNPNDLWNPANNETVAQWYMNKRIPQMLRHYGKPDTLRNRIISFNAGISYVVNGKPLPKITIAYLKKYGVQDAR